ncbi:hypothetical protein pb186bvf_015391 [Paramecium bursaria]
MLHRDVRTGEQQFTCMLNHYTIEKSLLKESSIKLLVEQKIDDDLRELESQIVDAVYWVAKAHKLYLILGH